MKEFIKETLQESVEKNSLGVIVSKPNQELIVMRGIPGAGKTTKAKSLVKEGKIHSTDMLIESTGDYRAFFDKMIAENDFVPLSRMHSKNLVNAIESMKAGITPVVIDNTNIKQNDCKSYVVEALKLGYADDNIKFIDIGTGGLNAEQLALRNTHGVSLDTIQKMIMSHKSSGQLTLKSVLESKDIYKQSDILYSAVVLDQASINKLMTPNNYHIDPPDGWIMGYKDKLFCDHMTIAVGKGLKDKSELGKNVTLTVTHIGLSDMAMAFKVEGYPSKNTIPHITLAVNPNGGKPVMSNDITKWQDVKHFIITGIVTEVKKNDKV